MRGEPERALLSRVRRALPMTALHLVKSGPDPALWDARRLSRRVAEARTLGRAFLKALQALAGSGSREEKLVEPAVGEVTRLLRAIESDASPAASDPQHLFELRRIFGKLLKDRRNAAGMSREQLGKRAKLSDATIKLIETVKHPPSRATLLRLLNVAELGLRAEDVELLLDDPVAAPARCEQEGVAAVEEPEGGATAASARWWDLLGLEACAGADEIEARHLALARIVPAERWPELLAARAEGLRAVRERFG